jgi:hypothetical protein
LTWSPATETTPPAGTLRAGAAEPSENDGIVGGSWNLHVTQPGDTSSARGEGRTPPQEPEFVEGYAWADRTDVPPLDDLTHGHDSIAREKEPAESAGIQWKEQEVSLTSAPAAGAPSGPPASSTPSGLGSSSAAAADDDLFPWELPASSEPERDQRRIDDETPDVEAPVPASSDFVSSPPPAELNRPRDTFAMEAAETTDTPSASNEPKQDRDDEDDDLESFQAWLRSLKR